MGTSTWSTEMDRRLRQMREDPQLYADNARKAARSGAITLVGVRKGSAKGSRFQARNEQRPR